MKQAISGVVDPDEVEVEVQTHWPSIAMYRSGQWLGRRFAIRWPDVYVFRLGYLIALLSIPAALFLYINRTTIRYTVTNRRVQIRRGWRGSVERSLDWEGFEEIEISVLDGYQWYDAGDLVFRKSGLEVFRFSAVVRPDVVRHSCLAVRESRLRLAALRRQQASLGTE